MATAVATTAVGSATRKSTQGVAAGRSLSVRARATDVSRPAGRDDAIASFGKRDLLVFLTSTPLILLASPATATVTSIDFTALQKEATTAYETADFNRSYRALTTLCVEDAGNRDKWLEGRAQVGVDLKKFEQSIEDYAELLSRVDPINDAGAAARFHAGKALAYEGLYAWPLALTEYEQTVQLASDGGFVPDPYIVNSIGNCYASLGNWGEAREQYLESYSLFQTSKGFRQGASTTQRLDGAVYASANAALAAAQLGNEEVAEREMRGVARRAPNSADMRAALAALLYGSGRVAEAEEQWEQACARNVGCGRYKDLDYVRRIRRWPPVMVDKLDAFLKIK